MKIFLDTADLEQIKKYKHFLDGVTTNPTLVSRLGDPNIIYEKHIEKIMKIVKGPISAETTSLEAEGMIKEGIAFYKKARDKKNLYVKVPCGHEGFKAVAELTRKKINTNVTLCFSVRQAWLAAKVGASFISPFVGRLEDQNAGSGIQLVQDILDMYDAHDIKTQLLAASIRDPSQVERISKMSGKATGRGVDIITLPPKVLEKLDSHAMTDKGIKSFLADARKYKGIGGL